jgi:predicted nuclease of restriction endonuclease-like RecB superfamily
LTPIESKVAQQLSQSSTTLWSFEDSVIPYTTEHLYTPDFTISLSDGRRIYIECKGWLRPEDRQKMLKVKQQNPDADIRFIFQADNKIRKGSKTTYTMWATKNGFPCSVGHIPEDWLV